MPPSTISMNSRDRVKSAIRFQKPDRIPISHAVLPAAQWKYGPALNDILADFCEDFGWDYMADLPLEKSGPQYRRGLNVDDFGTVWRVEWPGICGIPVCCPIPDLARYGEYLWPRDFMAGPPAGRQYSGHMCGFDGRWYARGASITFFEQLQQLRGMENLLMDIALESEEFMRLMDDLLAFNLRWIDKWNRLEYDGLHFGDDWGGAAQPPHQARSLAPPVQAALCRDVRSSQGRRKGRLVPQRRFHQ